MKKSTKKQVLVQVGKMQVASWQPIGKPVKVLLQPLLEMEQERIKELKVPSIVQIKLGKLRRTWMARHQALERAAGLQLEYNRICLGLLRTYPPLQKTDLPDYVQTADVARQRSILRLLLGATCRYAQNLRSPLQSHADMNRQSRRIGAFPCAYRPGQDNSKYLVQCLRADTPRIQPKNH